MIEVVGREPDLLGECPVWDRRTDVLYTIDIDGRCINRFDPSIGERRTRRLSGRPGSMALTHDTDRLLVAVEDSLVFLEWSTGATEDWLHLETGGPANRLNDGRCDRQGRFWVGSMHEDASESSGVLHRVDPDGTSGEYRRAIGVSNGLAFSPDGRTMYFADTVADTVWTYEYDPDTGEPRNRRVFTDFSDLPGQPDGGCVDAEGCYWTACVFGSAIARLTPDGAVDRIIELPVGKPTMAAFGGKDLDILFVTSIGGGDSHVRPDPQGANGRLLAIDVGVGGIAETPFGGGEAPSTGQPVHQ